MLLVMSGPAAAGGPFSTPQKGEIKDDMYKRTAQRDSCNMYASANGFGMVCNGPEGGDSGRSLVSYLNGRPLKECWDEPAPRGYKGEPQNTPGAYYQRSCLRGLDRTTLKRTGPLQLNVEIVYLAPEQVQTLTPGEEVVIRHFLGRGQIPYPVLQTGPTTEPRVRQPITFGLFDSSTPSLTTQGVTMYATVVQLKITPGDGSDEITCRGPGRLLTDQEVKDESALKADDVCSHTYTRSSAGAGSGRFRDRYPVEVTAFWQVRYLAPERPEGYGVVGTYTKRSINQIRTTEIQTLVVS